AAAVRNEVTSTPAVAIELEARVAEGELIADVTLEPQADLKGSLQLWVLESGIVARQTQPDGRTKQDYVHNNVFRASMNGHDGESVSLVRGIHQNFTSSIALRWNEQERWNPENLSVVAFVYNENGVQQVALATVAPEAN
ncbi:MAG: Omp28-related outer membrane protein, partial [Muribaculaceae bacterium]|nr:Omp28-related outer membrane protein [Muribaculaceae bacterium]